MADVRLLRWWLCCYLLWECLAVRRVAPAAVAAAAVAAGQEQCEVLDSNIQSTFSLPTNLTLKPTKAGWLLDFALGEGEAPRTACVRIQHKESTANLLLYKGDCKEGNLVDYNYLQNVSMTPHAWTTLALDVKNNSVMVTGPGGDNIQLNASSLSLPHDTLQVSAAQDVEVAVGCRVNCPQYKRASEGPNKKKKVRALQQDNVLFYFRPGEQFVRLEYEVTCTTTLGTKLEPSIAKIVLPDHLPRGEWHQVELNHRDDAAQVSLDYQLLKKQKLPKGCSFTEHTIKVVGDSHFSFFCNPSSGTAVGCSLECPIIAQSPVMDPLHAVGLTLLVQICLLVVVSMAVWIVLKRQNLKITLTPKEEKEEKPNVPENT